MNTRARISRPLTRVWFWCCAALLYAAGLYAADQHKTPDRDYDQGIRYEQAGQWQQAEAAFSRSIASHPAASAYVHRGRAETALGTPAKALDDLAQAIRLSPDDPEAFRVRGEANFKLGVYPDAVSDFTRSITLGAESSALYTARADAQEQLAQHQLAVDDYSKAIRLRLDDPAPWRGRGIALSGLACAIATRSTISMRPCV